MLARRLQRTAQVEDFPVRYTEGVEPWRVVVGETLHDDRPAGVPVVNATTYSSSTELRTVLQAVEAGVSSGCYVQLAATTYTINGFPTKSGNAYLGYNNGNRKIMGLIGQGADQTFIRVVPSAASNTPGAVDDILASYQGGASSITALYFSNTTTSVPLFFSGITFDGTLQTPFSVYSENAQTHFRINKDVASPICWYGMSMWRGIPGSRMQFCRFRGFGYALNTAPPFEAGAIGTNYMNGFRLYRCEIDGRVAASVDSSRPRASGGLMWNKGVDEGVVDSWMHHTRRSGWATNTNTDLQSEQYLGRNFQCDNIANVPDDGYAGDNGGFAASNVEEVVGTFTYEKVRLTPEMGPHIGFAIPYRSSGTGQPIELPTGRPIIVVKGFATDLTANGGLFRISVSKTPNSSGTSPAWTRVTTQGIDGSGLFDIRNNNGGVMSGVRSTQYNPAIHFPTTHYLVTYSD